MSKVDMDALHCKLELSPKCLPFALPVFLQSFPSIVLFITMLNLCSKLLAKDGDIELSVSCYQRSNL